MDLSRKAKWLHGYQQSGSLSGTTLRRSMPAFAGFRGKPSVMTSFHPTARSRIKRLPKRAHYDEATVHAILDAGFICHVGYVIDGQPYVTPTSYWREGNRLYWHGSSASRMLRSLEGGVAACLAVTHLDGLVVARSGFHHSINYRAVMAFGTAHKLTDPAEKLAALEAFVNRLYPGRWAEL